MSEKVESIEEARALTRRWGVVSEHQVAQLRMWPLVAVAHARTSTVELDQDKYNVRIRITTKGRAPKNLPKALKILSASTQYLLGPEWNVKILINGKVAANLRRKKARPVVTESAAETFKTQATPWQKKD